MHRHETELIEYPSAAEMRGNLRRVRNEDDVVAIDIIDLGKTMRVIRRVEIDEETGEPVLGAVEETDDLEVAVQSLTGVQAPPSEEPSEATLAGAPAPGTTNPTEDAQNASDEAEDLIGEVAPPQDTIDLGSMDHDALEQFARDQDLDVTIAWNTSDETARERIAAALEAKNG